MSARDNIRRREARRTWFQSLQWLACVLEYISTLPFSLCERTLVSWSTLQVLGFRFETYLELDSDAYICHSFLRSVPKANVAGESLPELDVSK